MTGAGAAVQTQDHPGRGWRGVGVVAALCLLQVFAFAQRFLPALLAQPLRRAFGIDDLQLGLLQGGAFIVPFAVALPLFGRLLGRLGPRTMLAGALGLSALAVAAGGLARSFDELLAARVVLGVAEAAAAPAVLAALMAVAAARHRATALAAFSAGGPLGKSLALAGGGLALLWIGSTQGAGGLEPWRRLALAVALLHLPLIAATLALAPRALATPVARPAGLGAIASPALLAACGAGICAVLASQTVAAWAPSLFSRAFHLGAARAGVAAGTMLLFGPPAGMACGVALDRMRGPAAAWALGAGLAATGFVAVAWLGATGLGTATVALGALAAALGAATAASLSAAQRLAPPGGEARVLADLVAAANLIGFGAGPALAGLISTRAGGGAEGLRGGLRLVLLAVCVIGAALAALAAQAREEAA